MARVQKILLGVTHFQSTGFYRGFIEVLNQKGADVHVVSNPKEPDQDDSHLSHATIHRLPMEREISILRDISSLVRWILLLLKVRPDTIAVGTPKAGLLGIVAGWLTRIPRRIYVVHGLRLETETGLKYKILLFLERIAAMLATDVQFVSFSLQEKCLDLKIGSTRKSKVIGHGSINGIDLDWFNRDAVEPDKIQVIKNRFAITDSELVIGFIGRLVHDKGIDDLVEALEVICDEFPSLHLLLVGGAEGGFSLDGIGRLKSKGIRVSNVGVVSDVRPFLMLMDVFVLPTHREGYPNVILEARAMEVPVVTTNATGAIDGIEGGLYGVLVSIADPHSLAGGISKALSFSDKQKQQLLGDSLEDLRRHFEQSCVQTITANYYLSL